MNVQIRPNSPLMRVVPQHWDAVALGCTIHLRTDSAPLPILAHEVTHCLQFAEQGGLWRGMFRWLSLLFLYGYEQHPWEREARQVEAEALQNPQWARRYVGLSAASPAAGPP